jgi:hypothetical protein
VTKKVLFASSTAELRCGGFGFPGSQHVCSIVSINIHIDKRKKEIRDREKVEVLFVVPFILP